MDYPHGPGMTTVGCWEGRHGDTTRAWGRGFAYQPESCRGIGISIDGYEYHCPCDCHGEATDERRPWLESLKEARA